MNKLYDVVIIGAGPAGTIAASKLIKENKTVLIVEKASFPRFVIGESLLPHCMDYMEELELLDAVHDLKFQKKTGVCFYHNDEVCDFLFEEKFTSGWDYTYQVKRSEFDHALAKETEKKGAKIVYEATVNSVVTSADKQLVKYTLANGNEETVEARFVLDASGYGRVLPRMFDLEKSVDSPARGAVFCHVEDVNRTPKSAANIFVHSFNDNSAWIWSIPFSDGTASVGIVGSAEFVEQCAANEGEMFKSHVANFPGLNGRYEGVTFNFEPRKILNYSVGVKQLYGEGYALCGNSTEFLDPIFSSGVTLAMASGYLAAELCAKQLNGEVVDWETDYSNKLKAGIEVFRSYVDAWYDGTLAKIFFAEETNEQFKRQICSVLAGYVWDESNPFVKKHDSLLKTLRHIIEMKEKTT